MFSHGGGWQMLRSGREYDKSHKLPPGTIKRGLGLASKYKPLIIAFAIGSILSALLGAVPPLLMARLIDRAIPERDFGLVDKLALLSIGIAIAVAGLGLAARWLSSRIGEGLIFDMRVMLFDHVQRLPLGFFTRTQTGALISRLNSDVIGAQEAMTMTLGTVLSNSITLVTTLAIMFALEWRITLLSMVILPAFLIPAKHVGRRLQMIRREQMTVNAQMHGTMQERFNVSGAMVSKLFGHADRERDLFAGNAGRVRDMGVRMAVYARTLFVVLGLVAAVGSAVVYWVGGRLAISGRLTPGIVVAFVAYVASLYGPLTLLTNARADLMTAFVSFERVFEVLDLQPSIADAPDARELVNPAGKVEFRNVSFRYPPAREVSLASLETVGNFDDEIDSDDVLRDVSFTIDPGKTVALVGPSGAGKTTISALIPRLYDVTAGAVLVDGHDVRSVTLESLRRQIGVVSQDPHLFHDTIANNLRFAKPDATDQELVAACQAAQIHGLIHYLPEGYETVVGERGYRLSGGEKQRLAIARVLLKQPRIVVLDEATSHLDSESESLIQRALVAALEHRTALVIAHRLSTIVDADEILVVERGRIVQRGKHHEMIVQDGLYRDLYNTQFRAQSTEVSGA